MPWVRVGISLVLLWWLGRGVRWSEVWQTVRACRWSWCLAGVGLTCLLRLLTSLRWKVLLEAVGMRPPFAVLLRAVWTSGFFEAFLPTTVGGDGIRVYSFSRFSGRSLEAFSSVAMERVLGAVSLALLAGAGAAWAWLVWGRQEIALLLIVPLVGILAAGLVLWHPGAQHGGVWIVDRLRWLPGRMWLRNAYVSLCAYRHHEDAVLVVLLLSALIHVLRVVLVLATAAALTIPVGIEQTLVVVPAILLFSMLPISVGQWGLREGAFVYLFGLTGLAAGPALTLSLISRVLTLIGDLPGLVFFLMDGLAHPVQRSVASRPVASQGVPS